MIDHVCMAANAKRAGIDIFVNANIQVFPAQLAEMVQMDLEGSGGE